MRYDKVKSMDYFQILLTQKLPGEVTNVKVINEECSIKITWDAPANGLAFPITKYEV